MMFPNGSFFSPDGGRFKVVGRHIFWEDGEVSANDRPDICIRAMPLPNICDVQGCTDYKRAQLDYCKVHNDQIRHMYQELKNN